MMIYISNRMYFDALRTMVESKIRKNNHGTIFSAKTCQNRSFGRNRTILVVFGPKLKFFVGNLNFKVYYCSQRIKIHMI